MIGFYEKESSYGGGVTLDSGSACSMVGYEFEPDWAPEVVNNKGSISGVEFGNDQEIDNFNFSATYKELRARPNSIAGFAALALGAVASTQDGAYSGYSHKCTRVANGTALHSTELEYKKGGLQWACKGIKCQTLKLSGQRAGTINLDAAIMGNGSHATAANTFAAEVSEGPVKLAGGIIRLETGANISIDSTLTQGAENISSATADILESRLENWELTWNNNLTPEGLHTAAGLLSALDYGRRSADFKMQLLFNDDTELGYFTSQAVCAIELDFASTTLIDVSGSLYYGAQIIIPRAKIKTVPLPKGGVNDKLLIDLEFDIQDDGTNSPVIIEAYNAKTAYLAAA